MSSNEISDEILVSHLDQVKALASGISNESSIAFAACCLERFASIYQRSVVAGRHPDLDPEHVRAALDAVWLWLTSGQASDWAEIAGKYRRVAEQEPVNRIENPSDTILFMGVGIIADFLTIIERNEFDESHLFAARNLEVIELLLDETEEISDGNQLFKEEMLRQTQCLNELEGAADPSTVTRLREQSSRSKLLGAHWFPSG